MISEEKYRVGVAKLWAALELDNHDLVQTACDGDDIFTVAANVIRRYQWLLTQFAEGNIHCENGVYTLYKSKFERLSFQGYQADEFIKQIFSEMPTT